jgi:hypothetical protein
MLVLTAALAKIEDEVAKNAGESDVSMAALVEQSRRCVLPCIVAVIHVCGPLQTV